MATSRRALAKAIVRASNSVNRAQAGPGGFGGAPQSPTMSPLVASYNEWTGGRPSSTAPNALPRDWATFLSGSFGPLEPMRPIPIDSPQDDHTGPAPRRFTYPVSWNLPHGVPGDEGLKLASFSQLRTVADTYSVARACIQVRIQEILGLEWQIVPTSDAEKKMRGDKEAHRDFGERKRKLVKFFRRPDPGKFHNFASWLGAVLEDIFVVDALSLYLQPARIRGKGVLGSDLAALCLIAGDTIRPMLDMRGGTPPPPNPAYQVYNFGVPRVDLMTALSGEDVKGLSDKVVAQYRGDQLMYMPYVARSWTPYGFPPIERGLVPILSGIQRQQWQLSYYSEGSTPGLFISSGDANSTPNQLRQLQDTLNAMAGDSAWKHKIIVLPKDSRIDPMRSTPLADQFDEVVMTQVCMAFDVQPMELGISPRTSTSQSGGAANQMAKASEAINQRKALKPLLLWLKRSIFDYIIQDVCGQEDMQWTWEGLEEGEDEEAQVNLLVNEMGHGLRSIDEARKARGEQPWGLPITSIPVYFTASGVTPIGAIDPETGHQPPPPMAPGAPGSGPGPSPSSGGGGGGAAKKPAPQPQSATTPSHAGAQASAAKSAASEVTKDAINGHHVPGTPYHYSHGWKPNGPANARHDLGLGVDARQKARREFQHLAALVSDATAPDTDEDDRYDAIFAINDTYGIPLSRDNINDLAGSPTPAATAVATGPWVEFLSAREMRRTAYEMIGYDPHHIDPHATSAEASEWDAAPDIYPDAIQASTYALMDGLAKAPRHQTLWRGTDLHGADPYDFRTGERLALPIASFADSEEVARGYGSDLVIRVLPGARGVTGILLSPDDGAREVVSGGEFEVVDVTGKIVTLRQVGTYDPDTGKLVNA